MLSPKLVWAASLCRIVVTLCMAGRLAISKLAVPKARREPRGHDVGLPAVELETPVGVLDEPRA